MKNQLKFAWMGILFGMGVGGSISYADVGEACYNQYASAMMNSVSQVYPWTGTQDYFKEISKCLGSKGALSKKVISASWSSATFAAKVTQNFCRYSKSMVDYVRGSISETQYGETFQLLTLLKNWSTELGHFEDQFDFLVKMNSILIEDTENYHELVKSEFFILLAEANHKAVKQYPVFAKRLLNEYLFHPTFCGKTENFQPLTFEELKKLRLSMIRW